LCKSIVLKGQENLLDFKNSLKFARYLSASGQYTLASEEFERLNFLWPGDTMVILELVQNYRLSNQCEKIIPSFGLLSKEDRIFKLPEFSHEFLRFALRCSYTGPQYFNVASHLSPRENAFYISSYYWVNGKFDSLFSFDKKNRELLTQNYLELHNLTIEFENIHYKKPGLALLMSMIIPGSGKAYSKNWSDALVSLIFVGTNTYASYRAFSKKGVKSVNGWIFGGLAISFYSANLWGSFKAAKKYNTDLNLQYRKNAENIIYSNY
jgi:hypothetical protein